MTHYLFVHWEKKKVVRTASRPTYYDEFYPVGRKAKQLFKEGYTYVGWFNGRDVGTLHEPEKNRKRSKPLVTS